MTGRPWIGITADFAGGKHALSDHYVTSVRRAGGIPVPIFASEDAALPELLDRLDGLVLSGGGDPRMEPYGDRTHPMATLIDPRRQASEERLLRFLAEERPDFPTLGICFGMQLMGLLAHGQLEQHLPDVLAAPEIHTGDHVHEVTGLLGTGRVTSSHHQALKDPGSLHVVSRADDGVIEAVFAPDRSFYLGLQWHPERTADPRMGSAIFERLVSAARGENTDPIG